MPDVVLRLPPRPGASVAGLQLELEDLLAEAGIAEPRQEARDILAAIAGAPRFWPAMHGAEPAPEQMARRAREIAARRASGAPFAYATGVAAFRHLTLLVNEHVLIPRQETEQLVEHVLSLAPQGCTIADIGTGSGAIALALATEGSYARVIATDVSRGALAVAGGNARRLERDLRAPVELRFGSMLAPIVEPLGALVSNPPYIALHEARTLPPSVRDWEPPIALFGGDDGMRAIAALVTAAPRVLEPGGLLALEIDSRRAAEAVRLAVECGAYDSVRILPDLAGRDRFLVAYAATTDGARCRSPQTE